jgi:hypothetical protein
VISGEMLAEAAVGRQTMTKISNMDTTEEKKVQE